jgi:hypothetical protein
MRVRQRFGYLHIPKAAGSSVTDAMRRAISTIDQSAVPAPALCPLQFDATLFGDFDVGRLPEPFRSLLLIGPDEILESYDVVIGHFSAPTLNAGRERSDLVTLLREPRSRLLSLYTFWRSWPAAEHESWDPFDASRHAVSHDWPQFLDDASIAFQIDNVMARMLLGTHPLIPVDGFIEDSNIEAVTNEASRVLDTFGHADVIENDPDCWARLAHWTGLDLDIRRRNTTDNSEGPLPDWSRAWDESSMMMLRRRTRIDQQLWVQAATRHATADEVDGLGARADSIARNQMKKITENAATITRDRPKLTRFPRASAALKRVADRLPRR